MIYPMVFPLPSATCTLFTYGVYFRAWLLGKGGKPFIRCDSWRLQIIWYVGYIGNGSYIGNCRMVKALYWFHITAALDSVWTGACDPTCPPP